MSFLDMRVPSSVMSQSVRTLPGNRAQYFAIANPALG